MQSNCQIGDFVLFCFVFIWADTDITIHSGKCFEVLSIRKFLFYTVSYVLYYLNWYSERDFECFSTFRTFKSISKIIFCKYNSLIVSSSATSNLFFGILSFTVDMGHLIQTFLIILLHGFGEGLLLIVFFVFIRNI